MSDTAAHSGRPPPAGGPPPGDTSMPDAAAAVTTTPAAAPAAHQAAPTPAAEGEAAPMAVDRGPSTTANGAGAGGAGPATPGVVARSPASPGSGPSPMEMAPGGGEASPAQRDAARRPRGPPVTLLGMLGVPPVRKQLLAALLSSLFPGDITRLASTWRPLRALLHGRAAWLFVATPPPPGAKAPQNQVAIWRGVAMQYLGAAVSVGDAPTAAGVRAAAASAIDAARAGRGGFADPAALGAWLKRWVSTVLCHNINGKTARENDREAELGPIRANIKARVEAGVLDAEAAPTPGAAVPGFFQRLAGFAGVGTILLQEVKYNKDKEAELIAFLKEHMPDFNVRADLRLKAQQPSVFPGAGVAVVSLDDPVEVVVDVRMGDLGLTGRDLAGRDLSENQTAGRFRLAWYNTDGVKHFRGSFYAPFAEDAAGRAVLHAYLDVLTSTLAALPGPGFVGGDANCNTVESMTFLRRLLAARGLELTVRDLRTRQLDYIIFKKKGGADGRALPFRGLGTIPALIRSGSDHKPLAWVVCGVPPAPTASPPVPMSTDGGGGAGAPPALGAAGPCLAGLHGSLFAGRRSMAETLATAAVAALGEPGIRGREAVGPAGAAVDWARLSAGGLRACGTGVRVFVDVAERAAGMAADDAPTPTEVKPLLKAVSAHLRGAVEKVQRVLPAGAAAAVAGVVAYPGYLGVGLLARSRLAGDLGVLATLTRRIAEWLGCECRAVEEWLVVAVAATLPGGGPVPAGMALPSLCVDGAALGKAVERVARRATVAAAGERAFVAKHAPPADGSPQRGLAVPANDLGEEGEAVDGDDVVGLEAGGGGPGAGAAPPARPVIIPLPVARPEDATWAGQVLEDQVVCALWGQVDCMVRERWEPTRLDIVHLGVSADTFVEPARAVCDDWVEDMATNFFHQPRPVRVEVMDAPSPDIQAWVVSAAAISTTVRIEDRAD